MEIIFTWFIPSKKNSKKIVVRWNRPFIISSDNYQKWQKEHLFLLRGYPKLNWPFKISISFQWWDKRKADLTNKAESIMDLLVDAWIIKDDNYEVVNEIILKYVWYKKWEFETFVEILELN